MKQRAVFANSAMDKVVAIGSYTSDNPLYSSDSGKTFYELKSNGFCGTSLEFEMTAINPHGGTEVSIKIKRDGQVLRFNDEIFTVWHGRVFDETKETIVPLPAVRTCEYLCQNPADGTLIYVSADKYKFRYESFKMFTGTLGVPMQEIPVQKVDRMRDGGTTYVRTARGVLFVPTPYKDTWKEKVTWNKAKVVPLDEANYEISEPVDGVATIVAKK